MSDRRSLVHGLNATPSPLGDTAEKNFVFGSKTAPKLPEPSSSEAVTALNTRLRSDYVAALKRASLERQLSGVEPSTLRALVEEAIGPWLRSNGYLE